MQENWLWGFDQFINDITTTRGESMNTYKITIEIVSDTPPDWIVPAIEDQLETGEEVKYFDYTIEEKI